jgi:hypothetical protein
MGCLPRRENSVRGVGRLSFRRTHKSSGNEGSSIVIETPPRSDSKTVSVDSHRQYDSGGFIFRIKGELTPFLCIFYAEKVCCYANLQTVLTVRHVPGNQNLIADALSRFPVPVNTEWKLHPVIFQAIALIWDRPLIDLFATSLNYKLETFVYPIPDQKAWAVDAMTISWKGMFNYIFPPFRLLHRTLHKIRGDGCKTILIAPAWPRQSWFPDLLQLSCAKPLRLSLRGDILSQFKGKKLHQGLEKLHLHAWLLSGRLSDRESFLKKQPSASLEQLDSQQGQYMTQNGQSFVLGVCQNKLILSESLLSN